VEGVLQLDILSTVNLVAYTKHVLLVLVKNTTRVF